MLSGEEFYKIIATIMPLYVAMILAYASVRFWKIFTPQQCAGINKYVATFAVPILSFHVIASCNFYKMNYRFLGADTLQKVVILASLVLWSIFSQSMSLEWVISFFSLSTIPNTLIIGIPLLQAMYGDISISLMVQIVVLQFLIWTTLLLILFEYRGAVIRFSAHLPDCSQAITTVRVNPDVLSVSGLESLEMEAESLETKAKVDDNGNQNFRERMNEDPENASEMIDEKGNAVNTKLGMPPVTVMTKLIVLMVLRKLIRNPIIYASILGLAWSLISFKLHLHMPLIVKGTIQILSDTGLGMAMFSLGLFMGSQPKLIPCGYSLTALAMALRFVVGPLVTAATSAALGLRGQLLRISIVQATLPAAIVPFVFANEYKVQVDIISVAVGFGTLLSLPVGLLYYVVLAAI